MEHEHDEVENDNETEKNFTEMSGVQADKSLASLTAELVREALTEDDTQYVPS